MAKSHITKKQAKKTARRLAEQQVAEEVVYAYVDWWATKEIQRLVNHGTLVIVPQGNTGYRIGHLVATKENSHWLVTNERDTEKQFFSNKFSAVFYCLFECKKMYRKSADLLMQDQIVSRLENDSLFLKHKYKIAQETKNSFALDLCVARLSDVTPRLKYAQEELQKMIISAKYIKIWDTQP